MTSSNLFWPEWGDIILKRHLTMKRSYPDSQTNWSCKEPLDTDLSNTSPESGSPKLVSQDHAQIAFEYLGNPCRCSVTCTVKKCFLIFRGNPLYFTLCPLSCVLSLSTAKKSLASSFFALALDICINWEDLSASAEQFQLSQPLLILQVLQSFHHQLGPLLDSLQHIHVSFILENPEPDIEYSRCGLTSTK